MKATKKLFAMIVLVFTILMLSKPAMVRADGGLSIVIGEKEKKHVMGYTKAPLGISLEKVDKLCRKGWKFDSNKMPAMKTSYSGKIFAKNKWGGYYIKKNGTGKVKVTCYLEKGKSKKTVTQTCTIKVVSFQSPFKKFAINGENMMKQIKMPKNKERISTLMSNPKKVKANNKVTYSLNKNWKIKSAVRAVWDPATDTMKVSNVKMKSGINLTTGASYSITVQNTKTKAIENYQFAFYQY